MVPLLPSPLICRLDHGKYDGVTQRVPLTCMPHPSLKHLTLHGPFLGSWLKGLDEEWKGGHLYV